MPEKYILAIFEELDKDNSRRVTKNEFLTYLGKRHDLSKDQRNKIDGVANAINDVAEGFYKELGIDQDSLQKEFDEYLESLGPLKPISDYFNGQETIMNNKIAVMKKIRDILKDLKNKPKEKQYWNDPEFGPKADDLRGYRSIVDDPPYPGAPYEDEVEWLRLKDIVPEGKTPKFILADADSSDVQQGQIGDCWLIGAMSVIATHDVYLRGDFNPRIKADKDGKILMDLTDKEAVAMTKGIYPPMFHWLRKYGIYVMKFFKDYDWKYVIIDDKLPCRTFSYKKPDLIFASCAEENEFWVPAIDDALSDFTGLVSEKLILKNGSRTMLDTILDGKPNRNLNTELENEYRDRFWKKIYDLVRGDTMMGCSITGSTEGEVIIDGENIGLISGHAYSIQDAFAIDAKVGEGKTEKVRLVRIRNPWGKKNPVEWNGAWSDDSIEMIQNRDKINEKIKELNDEQEWELVKETNNDDGSFFMAYKEFINLWTKLCICYDWPPEYRGIRFENNWTEDTTDGGTPYRNTPIQREAWKRNQQYIVNIKRADGKPKTHVFISLGQPDGRIKSDGTERFPFAEFIHKAIIVIFKLDANEDQAPEFNPKKIVGMCPFKQYRTITLNIELEDGKYAIVPSTMDMGQTGEYFLNVYHDCDEGKPGNKFEIGLHPSGDPGYLIKEEEEGDTTTLDVRLKKIMKVKAAAVVFDGKNESFVVE